NGSSLDHTKSACTQASSAVWRRIFRVTLARAPRHVYYTAKNAKNRPVYADRFFVIHAIFPV
ncbi:MAG: hypothetical protein Q4F18_15620, partial [Clostridia bacterium]|nr:hypothetical protein [Clostridia bacterium]